MQTNQSKINYEETYYFAHIINKYFKEDILYLEFFLEFFEKKNLNELIQPFPIHTLFHDFINDVVEYELKYPVWGKLEKIQSGNEKKLLIDIFIENFSKWEMHFSKFIEKKGLSISKATQNDLYEYYEYLQLNPNYKNALNKISEEIFFILFLNKNILYQFNNFVSAYITEHILNSNSNENDFQVDSYFELNGVLKPFPIPIWVKKAIIKRDRGNCANCGKEVCDSFNCTDEEHFNHILPLSIGGANDVTNIQLLRESCIQIKSKNGLTTNSSYEKWF